MVGLRAFSLHFYRKLTGRTNSKFRGVGGGGSDIGGDNFLGIGPDPPSKYPGNEQVFWLGALFVLLGLSREGGGG